MILKRYMPATGVVVGLCVLVLATQRYPGGTTDSASTTGYSWTHNFISSLFASRALNGAANPARSLAILAMLILCLSLGLMFRWLSIDAQSYRHKKTIEIAGIGSMVHSFLIVTRMHDLMVTIGSHSASSPCSRRCTSCMSSGAGRSRCADRSASWS
jgi:hypothetical protein